MRIQSELLVLLLLLGRASGSFSSLFNSSFSIAAADDAIFSGGASLLTDPFLCIRSGNPQQSSLVQFLAPLSPGVVVEAVSFSYRYTRGYSGANGSTFAVRIAGTDIYTSPSLSDYPYSKQHPNYSPPIAVEQRQLQVTVAAVGTSRLEIAFQNFDCNVQLLAPLTIILTCSGGPCTAPVAAPCTVATCAASVYYVSSPTLVNETLLIAGAGLDGASGSLYLDPLCKHLAAPALAMQSWEKSLKLVLPAGCGPPCYLRLTQANSSSYTVVQINQPDLWWASASSPSAHASPIGLACPQPALIQLISLPARDVPAPRLSQTKAVSVTLVVGELLRLFGRSLAWNGSQCVDSSKAPAPHGSTRLVLAGSSETGGLGSIAAVSANCYEATFGTTGLPVGVHTAVVSTEWGDSESFTIQLLAAPPAVTRVELDVLTDFQGDLNAAVAKAGTFTGSRVRLMLGIHSYALTEALLLPVGVDLVGQGATNTELTFLLSGRSAGACITAASNTSLVDFSLKIDAATNQSQLSAVLLPSGLSGFLASGLVIDMMQPAMASAFNMQGCRSFEIRNNTMRQLGSCPTNSGSRLLALDLVQHGVIANNVLEWKCAAFGADVSDEVVMEENILNCTEAAGAALNGGNYISVYDLNAHPSSQLWSVARNHFIRPPAVYKVPSTWQFAETLTTDAPHSYNMGHVEEIMPVANASVPAVVVRLSPRMRPPAGATLVVLGGSGAGQSRLVTGRTADGCFTIDRPFDRWIRPKLSQVAAVPTIGRKLIVGNVFTGSSVVQWFANTMFGVHADNTFESCNARAGLGGVELGGGLQVGALCYKGAPGQVFFTEYLGNRLTNSDGLAFVDNWHNYNMNDCARNKWFAGPWIQWAVVRRNRMSGISVLARHDANVSKVAPQCARFVLRAEPSANTSDLVAEHQTFSCDVPGAKVGGYDIQGCDHCSIRE